jgi:poly [ADP-ribose] polymerase 6/8
MATPSHENQFLELKHQYGSRFLWHGANTDRWHSIFRNGLRNAETIGLLPASEQRIHLSSREGTSNENAPPVKENPFTNPAFGNTIRLIALCEVANVPDLEDRGGSVFTLENVNAITVRFAMIVRPSSERDLSSNPPTYLTTLIDIPQHIAASPAT